MNDGSRFSFRLWLFAALRETGISEREFARRMSVQLRRPFSPDIVACILDGRSTLTGQEMLAAAIVTGISLQPNVPERVAS